MTWSILLAVPVVASALTAAWFVAHRARAARRAEAGSKVASEVFGLQVIGYPTARVDAVLDRLDAQIAANDALLNDPGPLPTLPAGPGPTLPAASATEPDGSPK